MKRKTDTRKLPQNIQQAKRGEIVQLRKRGKANRYVAETVGVSERHASVVWQRYLAEGNKAILSGQRGRPRGKRAFSVEQEMGIFRILLKPPSRFKVNASLWTRQFFQLAIKSHLDIDIPIRSLGAMMKRWGIVPERPILVTKDAGSPELQRWVDHDYRAMAEKAKITSKEVHWFIEKEISSLTANKVVLSNQHNLFLLATIASKGEIRFMFHQGEFTDGALLEFFSRLTRKDKTKVLLIVKRKMQVLLSRELKDWLNNKAATIELGYLPGMPETKG